MNGTESSCVRSGSVKAVTGSKHGNSFFYLAFVFVILFSFFLLLQFYS